MTHSIVRMINKYTKLEILCLDHCEMTDEVCKYVFDNTTSKNLQFLNISWNHLSGESLSAINHMLNLN